MCGALMTVRVSEEVVPLPASAESMVTLLLYVLSTALCTFTLIVQVPTAKVVFEKLILPAPAVAVTVPLQLLTTFGGVATTRLPGLVPTFVGRLSVRLASIGTVFPLVIENVMVLTVVPVPAVVWIVF